MKEKQSLCMEESTHKGEDTQRSVHAGEEEYTRRKNYTWRELHKDQVQMVECTHGRVYIWRSVHMEKCIHEGMYLWRSIPMEECSHGGVYT